MISCAALGQILLRELVVLLFIASGEMASAGKAHMGSDGPDAPQPQSIASLVIQ